MNGLIQATLDIGGNTINAQAIEQYILRKPTSSNKVNFIDLMFYYNEVLPVILIQLPYFPGK